MPGHGCVAMLSAACSSHDLERRYGYSPSMWTVACGCGPIWRSACLVAACAFYVVMAVYLIVAIGMYVLGPVSRYGLAKTSVVAIVSFALPAVAPSGSWALVATVAAGLSARAVIGVEEREAACVQLPAGIV